MGRVIGIRHRIKRTAEGDASPTQLCIYYENEKVVSLLKTEDDELDFIRNGLQEGDRVGMMLGGSGDNFAFALARHGQDIGASIFRVPAFVVVNLFGKDRDKNDDAERIANLLAQRPDLFYQVLERDLDVIWLRECLRARIDAMKARIACEQRLGQHLTGTIFCSPEGYYPEGAIEKQFDELKANDVIYLALLKEETKRERELIKACEALDLYQQLFAPIEGCGPMIASRIIGAVVDIRRFETKPQFRAFCGVHVQNGRFPRRRTNEVANWSGDCRQALYLLGEQFNRRPGSEWGQKLLAAKGKYRAAHPEVITENGKKHYTPGHIHKMATWYTLGKFAEWLFGAWWKLAE